MATATPRLGIVAVDRSLEQTREWLDELTEALGWTEAQGAWHALRAVLHAIRDEVGCEESARLGDRLPLILRGLLFEGWDPDKRPPRAFFERIADAFPTTLAQTEPERIAGAVFRVLDHRIGAPACQRLAGSLPDHVRSAWRGAERHLPSLDDS